MAKITTKISVSVNGENQEFSSNNFEDMWNELDEYEEKLKVRK